MTITYYFIIIITNCLLNNTRGSVENWNTICSHPKLQHFVVPSELSIWCFLVILCSRNSGSERLLLLPLSLLLLAFFSFLLFSSLFSSLFTLSSLSSTRVISRFLSFVSLILSCIRSALRLLVHSSSLLF